MFAAVAAARSCRRPTLLPNVGRLLLLLRPSTTHLVFTVSILLKPLRIVSALQRKQVAEEPCLRWLPRHVRKMDMSDFLIDKRCFDHRAVLVTLAELCCVSTLLFVACSIHLSTSIHYKALDRSFQ